MAGRALLGLSLALAFGGAALAHPMLRTSTPARGAVIKSSPKEIRVSFSEGVSARVSTFALTDAGRAPVALTPALSDPKDSKTLILKTVRPLAPGAYALRWKVGSDEHASVPGTLRFEIKP